MARISKRKNALLFDILSNGVTMKKNKSLFKTQAQILINTYLSKIKSFKGGIKQRIEINFITQKFHEKSVDQITTALKNYEDFRKLEILRNSIHPGIYYLCYGVSECLIIKDESSFEMFLGATVKKMPAILARCHNEKIFHTTDDELALNEYVNLHLFALWYKQNAGLEFSSIPGKSKKRAFECVYRNDSPLSVDILDANWYTTIIRVDPVVRKAHTRRQRYGKGRKKVKIIHVPEMLINGYTRKARMLNK